MAEIGRTKSSIDRLNVLLSIAYLKLDPTQFFPQNAIQAYAKMVLFWEALWRAPSKLLPPPLISK